MKVAYCATVQPAYGGLRSFNIGLVKALSKKLHHHGISLVLITHKKYASDFEDFDGELSLFDGNHFLFEFLLLPSLLKRLNVSIAIFPHNRIPFFNHGSYKTVCIFHDLLFWRYPENFSFIRKFSRSILTRYSARRCDYSFSVSDFTANELALFLPGHVSVACYQAIAVERIDNEAVNTNTFPTVSKPFFLFIGAQSHQKNLIALIRAFELFSVQNADFQLVVAGGKGSSNHEIKEAHQQSTARDSILFPGYVSDAQKSWLLRHAFAFVFPSTYEGFGIPLLEAFEAGTPVICSNAACLPEISSGAALEVDPTPPALAEAMDRLVRNPELCKKLTILGRNRVKDFSWEKTANIIISAVIT